MSSIVISGDTSGAITLAAPSVAGTNTVSLPAAAGTVMVSGNMPAFSAYQAGGATQNISSGVVTKISFNTKEFDTANAYDNTTNYRFQPLVAGYYLINATFYLAATGEQITLIYKNGSEFKRGTDIAGASYQRTATALVYLNGSTDYIEIYAYQSSGSTQTSGAGQTITYFQGYMVRAT